MHVHDVIVVGVGAMGACTLRSLAARGVDALGIEPFPIGHDEGSSGGQTRLIRKAYFEHPDYVPLLESAYRLWRGMEAEAGRSLLFESGILYLGTEQGDLIAGSRQSAALHGLRFDTLDRSDLTERFPQFRCPDGYVAAFEPEAGFLLCERSVRTAAELAVRDGAELRLGERVARWRADGDGVVVDTDRATYRAGAVVVTGGAWSARLLGAAAPPLTVTRQPLFWVDPPSSGAFDLGRSPCWAVQPDGEAGLFYGFPALPEALAPDAGVKLAHHAPGEVVDPDRPRRPATPAELGVLLDAVAPFVTGLGSHPHRTQVCMYTNSADGHFVIDRHPEHDRVVFGCGFSGHGFKFAPVIGEALADLALDGRSALPIGFLARR